MKVVYLTKPGKMEIVEEKRPMAGKCAGQGRI